MFKRLLHYANHPAVMIVSGTILAVASAWDLGMEVFRMGNGLESEHGTLLYGITVVMKSLEDLGEVDQGLIRVGEGREGGPD